MIYGYARVSSKEQNLDRQLLSLKGLHTNRSRTGYRRSTDFISVPYEPGKQ